MTGVLGAFREELRLIFSYRAAFSVLILAVAIYAAFYPQPYLNEALRDVPIAIVDQDGTQSSRDIARRVDASPDVAVAMVLPDLVTAEREVFARNIFGILVIPQNFERDLLHGRSSPVALYADASYFLMYQRIAGSVSAVARTLGAEVETSRLISLGVDPVLASAAADPLRLTAVPLFNPQGGYATYVLPAAFVLILQQTLLIGAGLLGSAREHRAMVAHGLGGAASIVTGKLLAYLVIEAVILPVYIVGLPYIYGIPRLGGILPILVFAIPFVLAVGALGMVIAALFRSPLAVQLASAAIGLPFFFLAGFAWPPEAMPEGVRIIATLVPSTFAIDGFVRLSQLNATLFDVRAQFFALWILALVYAGISVVLEMLRRPHAVLSGPA